MKAIQAVGKSLRDLLLMFSSVFCLLMRAIPKPVHGDAFAGSRRIRELGKSEADRLKVGATESPEFLRSA